MDFFVGFADIGEIADAFASPSIFANWPREAILKTLQEGVVHLAWRLEENYQGHALVIYTTKDGTLYEVNGSHCSCNGFGGQWVPERTSWESLLGVRWWTYHDDFAVESLIGAAHERAQALTRERHAPQIHKGRKYNYGD